VIRKMAELGYFGLIFPAEHGGMGLDTLSMAIVTEELSRGWLSVGSVMTRMLITGTLVLANGTDEQKRRFLPRICAGALLTAAGVPGARRGFGPRVKEAGGRQGCRRPRLRAPGREALVPVPQPRARAHRAGAPHPGGAPAPQGAVHPPRREGAGRRLLPAAAV